MPSFERPTETIMEKTFCANTTKNIRIRISTNPVNLRVACFEDIPALERLIAESVRGLQTAEYPETQIEAAIGKIALSGELGPTSAAVKTWSMPR